MRQYAQTPQTRAGRAAETGSRSVARHETSFFSRLAAGSALIATGGIATWGIRSVLSEIRTPEVVVKLSRLPSALSGYWIAMLTDLHVGPILERGFVEYVVETTNRLDADLIALGVAQK